MAKGAILLLLLQKLVQNWPLKMYSSPQFVCIDSILEISEYSTDTLLTFPRKDALMSSKLNKCFTDFDKSLVYILKAIILTPVVYIIKSYT